MVYTNYRIIKSHKTCSNKKIELYMQTWKDGIDLLLNKKRKILKMCRKILILKINKNYTSGQTQIFSLFI